jgi:hypothetical protein
MVTVFWGVTPSSLVNIYQSFREVWCFHFQVRTLVPRWFSTNYLWLWCRTVILLKHIPKVCDFLLQTPKECHTFKPYIWVSWHNLSNFLRLTLWKLSPSFPAIDSRSARLGVKSAPCFSPFRPPSASRRRLVTGSHYIVSLTTPVIFALGRPLWQQEACELCFEHRN